MESNRERKEKTEGRRRGGANHPHTVHGAGREGQGGVRRNRRRSNCGGGCVGKTKRKVAREREGRDIRAQERRENVVM